MLRTLPICICAAHMNILPTNYVISHLDFFFFVFPHIRHSCFSSLWSILLYLYVVSVFPIKPNSCSPKLTVKIRITRSPEKSGKILKFEHFSDFFPDLLILILFFRFFVEFQRFLDSDFTSEINYDYNSLILQIYIPLLSFLS